MRPCLVQLLPVLIAAAVSAQINGNGIDETASSFHKIPHPSGTGLNPDHLHHLKPTPKSRHGGTGHRRHRQQHPWMETNSQGPLEDRDIEATRTRYPDIEGRWLKPEIPNPPSSDKNNNRWHTHDTVDCYKSHEDGVENLPQPDIDEDNNHLEENEETNEEVLDEENIVLVREKSERGDIGKGLPSVKDPENSFEKPNTSNVIASSSVSSSRGSDSKIDSSFRRMKSNDQDNRRQLNKSRPYHDNDRRKQSASSKFDSMHQRTSKKEKNFPTEDKFSAANNLLKPFKEKKTVLVIGDEIVHFLRGEQLYGLCYVITESYEGLTVADATDRLSQLLRHGAYPDRVIVHVGANDLVLESPNTPYIVAQRLKQLWNLFKEADHKIDSQIFMSSVLPRPDEVSNFNPNVAILDYKMRSFANREGIGYIDHYSGFTRDGRVKEELYRFDGTLNEIGMRQFERVLFQDCDEGDEMGFKSRKKPSLELKDILPLDRKNYDKHVPPKKGDLNDLGDPTTVYFHVTVLSVDSIDEESMTYVADIFLAQSWHDHRLRLPQNMTEGYRILDVDWLRHIWRPDSFIKNAKKVTFHDMSVPNHYLWLYYDKTLLYMTKLTLEMSCAMKFEAYPHDTQICSMMIESLSHTTDDLVFLWNITDPLVVYPDIELPQLDISDNSTEDCTLQYSTGNFTCLAVVFNLKRRVGYHLFHTYIPTTLIVVMSWISFWIRPEAIPARVTLGVTSLLTLATQNTQSQSSLPPVSYVKAIDVWMSSCTVFVFMSLMEFALVNHFLGNIPTTKIMLGYNADEGSSLNTSTQLIAGNTLTRNNGDTLRSRARANGGLRPIGLSRQDSTANMFPTRNPTTSSEKADLTIALAIDKFSRFFFPLSFCILNIVYWVTYGKI